MQCLGYRVYMNLMMITILFWTLITPEVDLHMGILLIGAFAPSRYTWETGGAYKALNYVYAYMPWLSGFH